MTTLLPLDMSMWAGSEAKGGQEGQAEGVRRRRRGVRCTDKPQILQHLHLSS